VPSKTPLLDGQTRVLFEEMEPNKNDNLEYIFHPRSVAFAGVSGLGQMLLEAHLVAGFQGSIYPISQKQSNVMGLQCYTDVKDIPGPVDYVFASIPAPATPQFVQDCAAKGVKVIAFFTAGFSECDEAGKRLEAEIVQIARRSGMRLLGPNCMGIYCPSSGLAFALGLPQRSGPVGYFCQSGGNSAYGVRAAARKGAFFSKAISYGNACDLNECDFLEHFARDPETKVIAAYIEGVRDEQRFFKLLNEIVRVKPVIIAKGGRTESGAATATAHTGAPPASSKAWEEALKQANAIQVYSIDELADVVLPFLYMSPPKGRNATIVGLGGGASVIATDHCVTNGLSVPPFPEEIKQRLGAFVRLAAGNILINPIDPQPLPTGLAGIIRTVDGWDGIDMLFLRLPHNITPSYQDHKGSLEVMLDSARTNSKPTAIILDHVASPEAAQAVFEEEQRCWEAGLASFRSVQRASNALNKFLEYHQGRSRTGND